MRRPGNRDTGRMAATRTGEGFPLRKSLWAPKASKHPNSTPGIGAARAWW